MDRFEISLFGIRLSARGALGIAGAVAVTAMVLAYVLLKAG